MLFFSISCLAKEWETDHFSINLPDSLIVETDGDRRLLAFSKSGPYSPPFLSMEFGKEISVGEVLKNINESLKSHGGEMVSEACSPDCQAYYFEGSTKVENKTAYMYHYLVNTKNLTFIISYTDVISLEDGRGFVKNIGSQIRGKDI
jgi:hypothetical protein